MSHRVFVALALFTLVVSLAAVPATPNGKVMRRGDLPLGSDYAAHRAPFTLSVSYGQESVTVRRTVFALPLSPGETIRFSSPDGPLASIESWSGTNAATTLTAPHLPAIYGATVHGPGGYRRR